MEPIAIVGMSCLFPEAASLAAFWQNLLDERDGTSELRAADMGVDPALLASPHKGEPDRYYCLRGGYIRDFVFDGLGYRLPAERLRGLDLQAQWSLYVAREALRDSGHLGNEAALARCGVMLGSLSFPTRASSRTFAPLYTAAIERELQTLFAQPALRLPAMAGAGQADPADALIPGVTGGIVARALGLGSGHMVLDAACATSLYAVKLACQALQAGDADVMLAGAVSCPDPLYMHVGFSLFQAYPEGGRSRPLDRSSGGLFSGEGAGMFVLKRYADAARDGDRIYAVIRGVGLSNDGSGKHPLIPNPRGQVLAFERAYAEAQTEPARIAYVECHATGTPLGDVTELNSMDTFFGRVDHAPRIGSVKSNFGHLLTAAGMASMIKVVLSMQHGLIPATLFVDEPVTSRNGRFGAAQIVRQTMRWDEAPRLAGVSAFGFGGVNAHAVLEQPPAIAPTGSEFVPLRPREPLAVVGMDAHFGPCDGLDAFARSLYEGEQQFAPPPAGRWKGLEHTAEALHGLPAGDLAGLRGAFIDELAVDFRRYKMPPLDADMPIAQHLVLLQVADRALRDARMQPGGNVAVLVAMGTELGLHQFRGRVDLTWQIRQSLAQSQITLDEAELAALEGLAKDSLHHWPHVNQYVSFIGNVIASRVAGLWDFSGPAFTVSSEDDPTLEALAVARRLLAAGEVDAVVIGAADLAGSLERVLAQRAFDPLNQGAETLGLDAEAQGWLPGEGAGAVVVQRRSAAHEQEARVYALLEAPPAAAAARQAALAEVEYVELAGTGLPQQDGTERDTLLRAFGTNASAPQCALGSVTALFGHTGAAAGMASLIRTVLCLYERYIPGTPGWNGPKDPAAWAGSPLYVAPESRPWLSNAQGQQPRRAALSQTGVGGTHRLLLLAEDLAQPERPHGYLGRLALRLLVLSGDDEAALLAALDGLAAQVAAGEPLPALAWQCYARWREQGQQQPYVLTLVSSTQAELEREIGRARTGVPAAFAQGGEWKTPTGSYFTAQPLGTQGKVVFVYPGAFNAYPGLGQTLFQLYPSLYERFAAVTVVQDKAAGGPLLYPRSLARLTPDQRKQHEAAMLDESIAMLTIGTSFAALYTLLLRDVFGVQPQQAFGYSQGETTMMHALRVWTDGEETSVKLHASSLYQSRLSGRKDAVRAFWGLADDSNAPDDDALWANYIVMAGADTLQPLLADEPHVYLAIINGPREVMLSGDPAGCQRVIDRAKARAVRAPFNHVIHSPPVQSEYEAFRELHTATTGPAPAGVQFYSASDYAPITPTQAEIAHHTAQVCCRQLDFPRLVERVYADGGRIFLELGPARNCSRWIDSILKGRAATALSINKKGTDDHTSIVRVLAQLVSHRVPLDLAPLFAGREAQPETGAPDARRIKQVRLGGVPIQERFAQLPDRTRYAEAAAQSAPPEPAAVPIPPQTAAVYATAAPPIAAPATAPLVVAAHATSNGNGHAAGNGHGHSSGSALFAAVQRDVVHGGSQSAAQAHASFLRVRQEGLRQLRTLVLQRAALVGGDGYEPPSLPPAPEQPVAPDPEPTPELAPLPFTPRYARPSNVVWDEAALLEFARGQIGLVFGDEYAIIDQYHRRVRLPEPPYLLVSRVTQIDARRGEFKPCTITTEYDIPQDAWYSVDRQIPWAVAVESGQCDLLLISYLGIDFESQGERGYRLLDCTLTFMDDLPREGETLRYEIAITSFSRSGASLLFFFNYDCYVGDRMVLKMTNGCAGFFTDGELAGGKGVIRTQKEEAARRAVQPRSFAPPLHCARTSFSRDDMLALSQGDIAACFGPAYVPQGRNRSLRLPPPELLMLNRIARLEPQGGLWGLGLIEAEQDLAPDHWYFPCHFKDDQVMAGSLMAEACGQLLQFYLLFLGMQTHTTQARFQPIPELPQVVRCRGQVVPTDAQLVYRLEVTDIGLEPHPYAVGNVDVLLGDKVVVRFVDLGLRLVDEPPAPAARPPLISEAQLTAFASGTLTDCLGDEFHVFDGRRAPRTPNGPLQLMSRVHALEGERLVLKPGTTLHSAYDVPADAWFYQQNSAPTLPLVALIEIALQPCGFSSAYLGSFLLEPDADLYFRNLDGQLTLHALPDLRGQTITNEARLISSTALQGQGTIVQEFSFALACQGSVFCTGSARLGYFLPHTLRNQRGLDGSKRVVSWYDEGGHTSLPYERFDLRDPQQRRLFAGQPEQPHYRLAEGLLELLDEVVVVPGGGKHEQGYVWAQRVIDPAAWFFASHFHQDPVMPGSLGLEAMYQALCAYAIRQGIGAQFRAPRFELMPGATMVWKYRGQIGRDAGQWSLDIHIEQVEEQPGAVVLRGIGQAWCGGIRIYELQTLVLRVVESNETTPATAV